jgi:transcriptional regulator with XRE-family HTH domain
MLPKRLIPRAYEPVELRRLRLENQTVDNFAGRLMTLRAERRLSRDRLAKLMGVTKVTIWHWERGDSTPRSGDLLALARALDVSPEYLEQGKRQETAAGKPGSPSRSIPHEPVARANVKQAHVLSDVMDEAKRIIAGAAGIDPSRITVQIDY